MYLHFEWDKVKNRHNFIKHRVTFEEARSAFWDEDAVESYDPDHSKSEDRYLLLGRSERLRVLVISFCVRQQIRIISARKATQKERSFYERRSYETGI